MADIHRFLNFGEFTIDLANRRLDRSGEPIDLGSRYFDALCLLASHQGDLVSKDRFMAEVWKGIPVTDEALTQCIRTLRRALGDEAAAPRYIETVPKHGYQFVAPVSHGNEPSPQRAIQAHAGRIVGATTIGGLGAGLIGGSFYGLLGTDGGAAGLATLVLLCVSLSVLGASGIGAGMGLASLWRGAKSPAILAGGALGGLVVGALGSALASSGLEAITGTFPGRVTGMFEGMALGLSAGAAVLMAERFARTPRIAVSGAAAAGGTLAGLTTLGGGWFLGSTLAVLEAQFPQSHLEIANLGRAFGESGFGDTARFATAMLEGSVFAASIGLAYLRWRKA